MENSDLNWLLQISADVEGDRFVLFVNRECYDDLPPYEKHVAKGKLKLMRSTNSQSDMSADLY